MQVAKVLYVLEHSPQQVLCLLVTKVNCCYWLSLWQHFVSGHGRYIDYSGKLILLRSWRERQKDPLCPFLQSKWVMVITFTKDKFFLAVLQTDSMSLSTDGFVSMVTLITVKSYMCGHVHFILVKPHPLGKVQSRELISWLRSSVRSWVVMCWSTEDGSLREGCLHPAENVDKWGQCIKFYGF